MSDTAINAPITLTLDGAERAALYRLAAMRLAAHAKDGADAGAEGIKLWTAIVDKLGGRVR